MANATARIGNIAQPSRDDMDVSMIDGLPSGGSAVHADVHAVYPILFGKLPTDLPYQLE